MTSPATVTRMPAAFIGHGSPMNTLEDNRYTRAWRAFGDSVPRPRAVLVISAHWFVNATVLTAMEHPRTIHDFYGFPEELFAVQYPAPGAPEIAEEIAETLKPRWAGLDRDSWGLDHGTWSILKHIFPRADVPVLQLSINSLKDVDYHLDLATRLDGLRSRGILIVGSGNVVHNLRRVDFRQPDHGFDWAQRFDEAAKELMINSPGEFGRLVDHPDFELAVPSPDHFVPAVYLAGLAAAAKERPEVLVEGYAAGSLSMTSYGLGTGAKSSGGKRVGLELPDPAVVPPEDTNT